MAMRGSTAAGALLLVATLLGVGCAQGSGSYSHTGQMPLVEVLGAVEARVASPTPTSTTAATTPWAAPASEAADTDLGADADAVVTAVPSVSAVTAVIPDTTVPGETTTTVSPEAEAVPAGHEELAARTLARISYPWQTRLPGWEIVFLDARPSLRGVTLPVAKRIEIYVRSTDTAESLARVVAHELGHAADVTLNDALDRSRWRSARGAGPTVPWWPDAAATDFATLGGDFAEAFASWQTGVASLSTVAGRPTDDQLALLASLVS